MAALVAFTGAWEREKEAFLLFLCTTVSVRPKYIRIMQKEIKGRARAVANECTMHNAQCTAYCGAESGRAEY
jgi:hypothetical protein